MENGGFGESEQGRREQEEEKEGGRFVASNKCFFSIIQMSNMHLFTSAGKKCEGEINFLW